MMSIGTSGCVDSCLLFVHSRDYMSHKSFVEELKVSRINRFPEGMADLHHKPHLWFVYHKTRFLSTNPPKDALVPDLPR